MEKRDDSAVDRAVSILVWLGTDPSTRTVSHLCSELDIPIASAYRILHALRAWELIEFDSQSRVLKLGPRLLDLARAYRQTADLPRIALPYLTQLRDQTGDTTSLNIVLGNERICIEEARSVHQLNWSVPPGTRGPLYAGSTGKTILAFMRPEKLRQIRPALKLKQLTSSTPTNWDDIVAQFEKIKRDGYCASVSEVGEGVAGMAAPILDREGYSVGSINLSIPLVRWSQESLRRFIPLVKSAADSISREYGG
jgi:DNA-binding IclR family transcriptional regulator